MSRPFVIAASLVFAAAPAFTQQRDVGATVTVGTASARRGQTVYGFLRVPAGVDSATNLPAAVINGAHPGPVLALVAGTHGTQSTSIVARTRLLVHLHSLTISAELVVSPLIV